MPLLKIILNKIKGLEEKTKDTNWIKLTLQNSWTNRSGQNMPSYEKKNGYVYLHGLVYAGADTSNRIVATLPADCIPTGITNNLYFVTAVNGNVCRNVQVQTDGGILAPGELAQGQWFPLEGISFPVAD